MVSIPHNRVVAPRGDAEADGRIDCIHLRGGARRAGEPELAHHARVGTGAIDAGARCGAQVSARFLVHFPVAVVVLAIAHLGAGRDLADADLGTADALQGARHADALVRAAGRTDAQALVDRAVAVVVQLRSQDSGLGPISPWHITMPPAHTFMPRHALPDVGCRREHPRRDRFVR